MGLPPGSTTAARIHYIVRDSCEATITAFNGLSVLLFRNTQDGPSKIK